MEEGALCVAQEGSLEGKRELTVEDVLDALAAEYASQTLHDDEFTVAMFAAKVGESIGVASRYLDRLALAGKVTRRPISQGRAKWAYRMVDDAS